MRVPLVDTYDTLAGVADAVQVARRLGIRNRPWRGRRPFSVVRRASYAPIWSIA